MKTKIEKLPKSTIKITVTVDNDAVKKAYEKTLENAVKTTTVEGFRPGAAPKDIVKEKIGQSKLFGDAINDILETYYPQALKENAVNPVSNPKVEIKEFDLEKELEFTAVVAVRPEMKIGEYKKKLKEKFDQKWNDAVKESEESKKDGKEGHEPHVHMTTGDVIETLMTVSEADVSEVLLEDETDRLLSRFMDQAQSIGLSLDQYLKSQNKTGEQLRDEYTKIAEKNIKAEFVLSELIKMENVEVSDEEIDEMIKAAGDPNLVKSEDPMQKLYIKSILQKNKLISKLAEEAEGDKHHEHK
ncbi:MAG: trigger factor [candidate division WWE3 bacterium GW2011_GWF2_41_45]|uniref:Trigger factor n=2 Tax=Katanobacteria TaxID=422282 RepID=A0A1F4W2D3_UNCKA|nr:MAG: trigger factor [candidate division WWE3 bacterium GW2011_GWF2_41_45]KKS20239.1 MAG: trigger factor [candidate division WWE3 bacterium GW2011_GWE1_41_72]KKS26672.1 MAG: trigger factor [candidate division WWE3 bacterium GW2011_GWC1_42_102]KKS50995.1 MAG: trigger factor [candidate division WWE3 bacterium GW2011_GWE2_42_25]KKS59473.1 MAG: trigger factor [candidate division WWE3 bacterium GW2011_GWB1_42_41]KKS60400.1 MAG: trigger factor [candidate division WWE3 bacterium GW2011_GWA1_42_46]